MKPNLRWTPFYALLKREIHRTLKVVFQTLATPLINALLYLLIFGVSLGNQIQEIQGHSYLAFLIPGLVMMGSLRNAFENASGSIITSKFIGELEDLRMVPLSPIQIAWGNGLAATLRGLVVGGLTLTLGIIFYWITQGELISIEHPLLLLFFLTAGGLSFAQMGLSISMICTHFEQVSAINTFILLPLIYLGGVFFSLAHLHPFWQTLSELNPILYLVNGVRYSILGAADVPVFLSITISCVTVLFFHCLALWSLHFGSYRRW